MSRPRYFSAAAGQGWDMVLHVREVREAEEVGPEEERGGEGPVARRGVLGVLPGGEVMGLCPWCYALVSDKRTHQNDTQFAAHVARCSDAPESAKAAYRVPLYPPAGRR